jgi:hypothetical protein
VIVPQCGPEEKSFLRRIFLRGKRWGVEEVKIAAT